MSTLKLSLVGLGSRVFLMGIGITNVAVLARFLEPDGRGKYFLFQTVLAVLTALADGGFSQAFNVLSARHLSSLKQIHSLLIKCALVCSSVLGAAVGSIVLWGGSGFIPNLDRDWLWVAFMLLPLTVYAGYWNAMMIGLGEVKRMNLVQIVLGPLHVLLVLTFVVALSGGVHTALSVYVAIMLLQGCIMFGILLSLLSAGPEVKPVAGLHGEIIRFGLRGYLNQIATLLWARIPVFVLNLTSGTAAVGIFSVAQQLSEKLLLPMQAVQDAIFRKIAAATLSEATRLMNRYMRLSLAAMGFLALCGVVAAPLIVRVLFGDAYEDGVRVLRILLLGTVFLGGAVLLSPHILGQLHRPGLLSLLAMFNVLICFGLSLWLAPRWSAVGVAIALAATQITGAIVVFGVYLFSVGARWCDAVVLKTQDIAALKDQAGELILWMRNVKG